MTESQTTLPNYWLPQPPLQLGEDETRACDELLATAIAHGVAQPIAYTLSIPKWQFLSYVVERHNLALHGSSNGEITIFEPRQPNDLTEFGAQNAVYAAADGIWPIYFAIVDRDKSPSIINACIAVETKQGETEQGEIGPLHYLFSISQQAVDRQPYQRGMVYLLPRASFVRQPPMQFGTLRIHTSQLASTSAVLPLAKLEIGPEEFPFLAQMRTHDDERLSEYAEAMMQGLPWPQ